MDMAGLRRIVDKYGEQNILSFITDNNMDQVVTKGRPFSWETWIDEDTESVVEQIRDQGRELPTGGFASYIVLSPIENIQKVLLVDPTNPNWDDLDYRAVRL